MENVILVLAERHTWCVNCYEAHKKDEHTKPMRPLWCHECRADHIDGQHFPGPHPKWCAVCLSYHLESEAHRAYWCARCTKTHEHEQHVPPAIPSSADEWAEFIEEHGEIPDQQVSELIAKMGGGYRIVEPGRIDNGNMTSAWKETPSGATVDPSNPRGVGTDAPRVHNSGDYL